MALSVYTVPKPPVTVQIDYYIFKAMESTNENDEIGTEIDATATLRYTGNLGFRVGWILFSPGNVFGESTEKVSRFFFETQIKF